MCMDFLGSSDGKESVCNAGDLGQEDPLEKGMAIHSCILAWTIPWIESVGYSQQGHKESDMTECLTHTHTQTICIKSLKIDCSNIVIEQDAFEC